MDAMLENEWILLIGIVLLAVVGYKCKALSLSGAFGTLAIGVLSGSGFKGYGLLLIGAFFISSSFWSRYNKKQKASLEEVQEKSSQRDIIQVMANGGVPAFFSVGYFFFPSEVWLVGFVTAIAVANSDTWASEIGTLSKKDPISIRNFRKVEKGASGAISGLGTGAALLGSAFIAIIGAGLWEEVALTSILIITLLGTAGCFIDTVLGAWLQASYQCKHCGQVVERKQHCHQETKLIKGFTFVNNDVVNIASIFITGLLAALFIQL